MILKNNSEKVIKLVRYYETLEFADKLKLAINIFESDYIKIKSDKMLELLKQILRIVDTNYNKYGMINFLEYKHLLLMSAQVMEMTEKEQSDFVIKNKVRDVKIFLISLFIQISIIIYTFFGKYGKIKRDKVKKGDVKYE